MKNILKSISLLSIIFTLASCEKDAGKLPNISFNSGAGYISSNTTVPKGSPIKIGIIASKAEDKDVLKKFNVTQTLNGTKSTLYDIELYSSNQDNYNYTFEQTMDTVAGKSVNYIFTVTNRDGLTNNVSLTVTTQ